MTKIVYLCGPMEGISKEDATNWRDRVRELLPQPEFRLLDPMRFDLRGKDSNHSGEISDEQVKELVEFNLTDIDQSDFLIVFHPHPSTGTDMEVLYAALREFKPKIIVVIPEGIPKHPWLRHFATRIVPTVDIACAVVKAMQISGHAGGWS